MPRSSLLKVSDMIIDTELDTDASGDPGSLHAVMREFPSAMITDVLSDCGLSPGDERTLRELDDLLLFEKMTTAVECPLDSGKTVVRGDIHDLETLKRVRDDLENGQDFHHILCDPASAMWPPPEEENNFPDEVLLEVEVITSWDETRDKRIILDLDGGEGQRTILDLGESEVLDGSEVQRILDECSDSSGDYSDYGSESGTENMDLSTGTTLDLSKKDSNPETTQSSAVVNLTRAHIPTHLTGTVFDMSQVGYSNSNNSYLHYSGGTTTSLDVTRTDNDVEHTGSLLDLSKTGQYYNLPRVKLEPNLSIDPTIQYKPEMDYNHNEAIPSTITNHGIPKYKTIVYDDECIAYKPETPELNDMYNKTETTDIEMYSDAEPRVKVEQNYSSQCQNIPLTVTSPDDDNDSGAESLSSNSSSEKSRDNKLDRKRPGRKKGQVSKVYHLWEFIRDVLADARYCPSVIKWENEEEGIFRVVQSETAASLWGARKNNRTKMTYEKMSRSIRYSRKEGYFADIPKDKGYPKKLCFKFGKKAHGWSSKFKICAKTT